MSFKEIQYLTQSKLFLVLGILILSFVGVMIVPIVRNGVTNSLQTLLFIFIMLLILLIPIFILWGKLITLYDEKGVSYQFIPFHWKIKTINWKDVKRAYIRKYRPLSEYGGWGIRYGFMGKAYNISGNIGLQLELKNGKKILIGTRKPQEVENVLNRLELN